MSSSSAMRVFIGSLWWSSPSWICNNLLPFGKASFESDKDDEVGSWDDAAGLEDSAFAFGSGYDYAVDLSAYEVSSFG